MSEADLLIPPKLVPIFTGNAFIRGAEGGRSSAKTRTFAKMTAVRGYELAKANKRGVIVCGREHLNSLDESSMEEIKNAIRSEPFLDNFYDIGEKYIRTKCRRISYAFAGLRHNLDSIKSKAFIHLLWVDEAANVSEVAWRKTIPTIREIGSEIWVTWNREVKDSPTDLRFYNNPSERIKIANMNWRDNPWFTDESNQIRLEDLQYRPDTYDHVWEGDVLTRTDAQVFAGKFEESEFTPLPEWDGPYYGSDWGFSNDPTTLNKLWIYDGVLYIEYEANSIGCELDDIGKLFDTVPGSRKGKIRADCSRPETISHVKRQKFKIEGAKKWPGSVEDGVEFIRSFKKVVIHPRCTETGSEFRLYSYKVDRLTDDVTTDIVDKYNHHIDGIRYALQPMISKGVSPMNINLGRL